MMPPSVLRIAEQQGWAPETVLDLALDYLIEHGWYDAFLRWLASVAATENAPDKEG